MLTTTMMMMMVTTKMTTLLLLEEVALPTSMGLLEQLQMQNWVHMAISRGREAALDCHSVLEGLCRRHLHLDGSHEQAERTTLAWIGAVQSRARGSYRRLWKR